MTTTSGDKLAFLGTLLECVDLLKSQYSLYHKVGIAAAYLTWFNVVVCLVVERNANVWDTSRIRAMAYYFL
jgi:hypothetical protein